MNINEYNLINRIYKYIILKQQISLIKLKNDFKQFVIGINANYSENLFDYNKNFYYIIDFLLINGYIEYSYDKNYDFGVYVFPTQNKKIKYNNIYYIRDLQNLFYTTTQSEIKDFITLDPLNILKALPKVEDVCTSFKTNDFTEFKLKYDKQLKLKSIHQDLNNYNYEVGIYKKNDFGNSFLVLKDHTIKRIPRKYENYDALNSSFCYSAIFSGLTLFKYNPEKSKLIVNINYLPIIVHRVLYMCDFTPILNTTNINYPKFKFNNINKNIITELRRIFSKDSIGEIDD